jgi:hypothetical protein
MARGDDFMKNGYEKVGMGSGEHGNVHRHRGGVGFVESHAKVSLAGEKQEDEDADVHETDAGWKKKT